MLSKQQHYINLSTKKRDGTYVNTPVWFAHANPSTLYVYSVKNSGKVKRIRNFRRVRLASCNAIGKLKGEWFSGDAILIDKNNEIDTAFSLLRQKYGYRFLIANICSKIVGNYHRRQIIKLNICKNT
tara:strand:+ start:92 stop:472 length:381 start_codon:yes stop_codon:yes gene_type:complete